MRQAAAVMSMDELLRSMRVWRGRGAELARPAIPTGFDELDRYLPGGGWPRGAVTEICLDHYGIGELTLLLAGLARLVREGAQKKWIVWVAPPFIPYAPALQQHGIDLDCQLLVHPRNGGRKSDLWAVEQAVRSGSCAAVLAWVQAADEVDLRRLQLAAEERSCWVVLFRPLAALESRSPAALRLKLSQQAVTTRVSVVKCRGRQPAEIGLAGFAENG